MSAASLCRLPSVFTFTCRNPAEPSTVYLAFAAFGDIYVGKAWSQSILQISVEPFTHYFNRSNLREMENCLLMDVTKHLFHRILGPFRKCCILPALLCTGLMERTWLLWLILPGSVSAGEIWGLCPYWPVVLPRQKLQHLLRLFT